MPENRSLWIVSRPAVAGGAPLLDGVRIVDLLDRIDAGDQLEFVAEDFNVEPDALSLLLQLREELRSGVSG